MFCGPPSLFALAAAGLWPPDFRPPRRPIALRRLGPAACRVVGRLIDEGLLDIFDDDGEPSICWMVVDSYLAVGSDLEPEQ